MSVLGLRWRMLIRRIGAMLLGLAGIYAFLGLLLTFASADHTIANGRRLNQEFRQAATAAEAFRRSQGRLPTSTELRGLLPPQPVNAYELTLSAGGFDLCGRDAETYKAVGSGNYILAAWRGEWWECYAPSQGKTTLLVSAKDFTMTGSMNIDRFGLSAFTLLCFCSAVFLWRGRLDPSQSSIS